MPSARFDLIARMHRIYVDADPDGSNGGWSAEKVQQAVTLGWLTQEEADLIIETGGNVGVLRTAATAE